MTQTASLSTRDHQNASGAAVEPLHNGMANAIRFLAADAVQKANSGHPGMPMGLADVATVLFTRFLKFDSAAPAWPDRDRFVLSAGHGSMLLYSLMYLTGYKDMTLEQLKASASSGRSLPVTLSTVTPRPPRPPRARWARVSPMPWVWPWAKGCLQRGSATVWSTTTPTSSPEMAA
jgi:hypothetical protein